MLDNKARPIPIHSDGWQGFTHNPPHAKPTAGGIALKSAGVTHSSTAGDTERFVPGVIPRP